MFWTKLLIRTGLARFVPGIRQCTDEGQDFLHYYSGGTLAGPFEVLHAAADYWEPHEEPDAINLALGAPLFDLTPSIGTKLPGNRRGYPPVRGLPELRAAIADRLEGEQQLHVAPEEELLITHGSAGALSVLLDTFVSYGDRVVLFDPCSPLYSLMLRQRRAGIVRVAARPENGFLRFRHDHLARALRNARLLILNVPANPTGASLSPEDVEEIAWWADRQDVLIYYDQAFARFYYDGDLPAIGTLASTHRRTLTAGSMSKGHALASARVGWLAGHRHLIRPCLMNQVLHTPFVPTLCQQLALAALEQPEETFKAIRTDFAARRRYVFERLQALGLEAAWPAGGFFFWVNVASLGITGRVFADRLRQERKVLVSPGEFFGPSGKNFIRLSFATEEGRLREGLNRLAEFVQNLTGTAVVAHAA